MKDFDDNKKELKNASFLNSLKKENVFNVPENYFDKLAEELEDKIEDEKVFETYAPTLLNLEKKNVYLTPNNYFDDLPKSFSLKLESEINNEGKIIKPFWKNYKSWVGIAASLILIISAGIWFTNTPPSSSETDPYAILSEVPTEMLLASVDVDDYDVETIVEAIGEEAFDNFGTFNEISIDEDELNDVLDQIDVSDLEAEFDEFLE